MLDKTMQPQQNNTLPSSELTEAESSEPRIGFGAAQSEDQMQFDEAQAQMSEAQIDAGLDALIATFRQQTS